jgi:dipeptidyl aminopeptidase/acylaminoacyl peptidase
MLKTTAFVCVLAGMTSAAFAARPVTFDDILQMRRVADAAISPDGRWVLYTIRQWETSSRDPEKKEQRSQVWRVATDGTGARALTVDEAGANAPAWSPNGRYISFLSARRRGGDDPKPQIWIMRTDGGEAVKLTDAKDGVASYAWSPDGMRVAYVSRDAETRDVEARRKSGDDRRIFEGEFRMAHLWVVDVASQASTRITDGSALTISGDVSWSPDNTRVVFAAAPTPMLRDNREDIYIARIADRGIEKITTNSASDTDPVWSPDGQTIAFMTEPGAAKPGADGLATRDPRLSRLALYDVRTKAIVDASDPKFESEPANLSWTSDSSKLIFNAGKGTYTEVFSYDTRARRYAQLTTGRVTNLGSVAANGAAAFVMESASEPAEIYTSDLTFVAPRKLTTANPQTSEFSLGASEVITWKNDGLDIEGVLVKPVGFTAGTRYPLLVVVHGGPAGAHVNNFRVAYGDGGQHWAGQGWAVLYPNPRGGTNYGEKFLRANIPDWGGGDYRDIIAGVDAVIAKGIADPDRLAIQGWSYGGYMTAWTITQTTRFKAAMVGAGITNLWSMYGTNDLPNYLATFFRGIPSKETLPLYMERSALSHLDKVTTPTLILHGGNDERVPIGQPMELYRGLKEHGTPVELVFYPRQGHGLQEYYHQRDRLQRQYDWITKYTLGDSGRKTTSQ